VTWRVREQAEEGGEGGMGDEGGGEDVGLGAPTPLWFGLLLLPPIRVRERDVRRFGFSDGICWPPGNGIL